MTGRSLARLQKEHGAARTLELAAARIRADASYLAKWTGSLAAAQLLTDEAHRLLTEAAAGLAAPTREARAPSDRIKPRRSFTIGRAAAWSIGILAGIALGLGISG